MSDDLYLVWSNEHRGWWGPGRNGYTPGLRRAGRYSRAEALEICRDAIPTAGHIYLISEIPVRLSDVEEFLTTVTAYSKLSAIIIGDEKT